MQFILNRSKRFALIVAAVMLMMTALAALAPSYATLHSIPTATQINELSSSKYHECEYYKVRTPLKEKNVIYVEGKTKEKATRFSVRLAPHGNTSDARITAFVAPDKNGEFSIKIDTSKGNKSVPTVIDGKGTVTQANESYGTVPGYKAVGTIEPGYYHLLISKAITKADGDVSPGTKWWEGHLGGSKGYAYKEAVLLVKPGQSNNPKVIKYQAAINNNNKIRNMYEKSSATDSRYKGSYVRYQDVYLKDMQHLLLDDPKTGKVQNLTAQNVKYIKNTAKKVTAGAKTDYQKAGKIFVYVASNIYYDTYAHTQGKNQYDNPYKNLYNLQNKTKSPNSINGKVATTCQGYAGMIIAMARAEGIPARIVNGHHISQCSTIWSDEKPSEIERLDHWWAELWIDNRWVPIDANAATESKWQRKSWNDKGTWNKACHISYGSFDPSPEQMSDSYSYNGIYPGATDGKYICNKNEVNQLKAFLNYKSGKTNGKKLNSKYSASNYATWGTTASDDFMTDGYGRVTHISWGKKNLAGNMNLSNFKQLRYLTVYSNQLKTLNLTGCSSLIKVSATGNKLTKFDSSASKNVTNITTKGNKLTSAKFKNGSKTVTISRNVAGGTFAFDYNKSKKNKLTIYVNGASKGYKYLGIYNSSGKKLSSSTTYSCSGSSSKYVVKFAKK